MTSKWPQKLGADCANCPLRSRRVVPPEPAMGSRTELVSLGDAPGKTEVAKGLPLVGAAGGLHNQMLTDRGLDRTADVHVTNAVLCQPKKHMTEREWGKALECCRPRLAKELAQSDAPVLVQGKRALQAVSMHTAGVQSWRGYPLKPEAVRPGIPAGFYMPAYHPAFIQREPWHLPFYELDIDRALAKVPGTWEWGPTYKDRPDKIAEMMHADIIGLDVENGGSTHPMVDPLLCVGVGTASFAVTVDWQRPHPASVRALRTLLESSVPKVLQNLNHDRLSLTAKGVAVSGPWHDTLPLACIIAPKAKHDLGTLHNWYYYAERWKSEFSKSQEEKGAKLWNKIYETNYDALAAYNGKDCMATVQIFEAMIGR